MKVKQEVKSDRNEMSLIRWICGFTLKETKKKTELRESLSLEPGTCQLGD